jgi:hypothetical protein
MLYPDYPGDLMSLALLEPLPVLPLLDILEISSGPSGGDPNGWCTSTCGTSGCNESCFGNSGHNGSHACHAHG